MQTEKKLDLTRIMLATLLVGLLLIGAFMVLRPFLLSITWAAMIVVATWPLLISLQRRLGNRRSAAVVVLTLGQLAVLFVPLMLAIVTIVDNAGTVIGFIQSVPTMRLPAPPQWLTTLPGVGPKAAQAWQNAVAAGPQDFARKAIPYADNVTRWFAGKVGGMGLMTVQFLLTVVISSVMYSNGEALATSLRKFAHRLSGDRGEELLLLASQAIRGVALGVGVTALVQAILAGLGLAAAGVPGASILTAVTFMLCIAQLGALLVLIPACAWLYWTGEHGWGTFMLIWALVVGNLDAFLRPVLIKRGADLPLMLILTGVIGGLIAFGLVGLFLGPLILAVGYTLLSVWVNQHAHLPGSKAASVDPLTPD